MPRPSSSPREGWVEEVAQGFMLYRTAGRDDLKVPDEQETLAFFQAQATDELQWPSTISNLPDCPLPLQTEAVRLQGTRSPAVTNVRWIDIGLHDSPALVYCDINTGGVVAHWPRVSGKPTKRLGTLLQPVHVEPCDLDEDGLTDLVVADIGEFNADDSDLGRVVWLRRKPDSESFEKIVLQENLSRVADVQPGDFDGDGDTDLLVAAFGWRNTGRTFLMDNTGIKDDDGRPQFKLREIDERHGPVNVTPIDLNNDGHLDFVSLLSQEHEAIEAFINDGTGHFKNEIIYQAPDPAYGSSGIELVDMDGDGDMDVLFTNGDSFDRGPKPYHGVQWLENNGAFPYQHHRLCDMPGVLNARAADFDGDGDMDVVAVSLLARTTPQDVGNLNTSSIIVLIQSDDGTFETTSVENKFHQHISVATGDFDDDGDVDFATGNFIRQGPADKPDVTIYWNKR
ncbi:MAG: VCBS repeat-containing protein [Pirellulaceae bacterium]|nr:VCBS repeat-containing protein [Pirellulaceae bacterium]